MRAGAGPGAGTGAGVSEYIASSPAAQLLGISAADIVRLAQRGKCVLMVNGWNEIPAEQKLLCREAFNQLTEAAPELVVVVATRTAHDIPTQAIEGMFWLRVPMGQGIYEVHPKACNALRRELYRRAKTDGRVAVIARQALASLECSRRQGERPNDEPRHPEHHDGQAWTQGLVQTLRPE